MLTKESRILIKNVWESKKYGVTRLIKEFLNKKWSKRGVEDFLKQLRSARSIERASDSGRCAPCHRRVEASSVGLCRRWRRTFWALFMIATLKITMSKWQHCKCDNWRWLFLFSFAVDVNDPRIIAFLAENCFYLILQSKVRTQLRWCGKFYYSRM